MAARSRPLLFTAEPLGAEEDIFPREVRPSVMRMLWLGLLAVLVVLTIIMFTWRIGGV